MSVPSEQSTVSTLLAREAQALTFDRLPAEVVHAAKRQILDTLACAIGGYPGPSSEVIRTTVDGLGGRPESTVIGSGTRTSCANAALANGVMVRYTEFMDEGFVQSGEQWVRSGHHPGELIPSGIAVAEREHASGRELIASVVLGYELLSRFGEVLTHSGWASDTNACYVVPLVVGKLLRMDRESLVNALGIAGSFAGVLKALDDPLEHRPMARNLRFPYSAYQAIVATLMARDGFTGPNTVFEGPYGYNKMIAGDRLNLKSLVKPIDQFTIVNTSTKLYACFGRMIGSVDAALRLVTEHDIKADDILTIRVITQPRGFEESTRDRHPLTKQAADHSFYYVIAVAVIDRMVTPAQFRPEKLSDARVHALSEKIEYSADAALAKFQSAGIVEIQTKDKRQYSCRVDIPRGKPGNLMTDEEIASKFRSMASSVLTDQQTDQLISTVFSLEAVDDVADLMPLLVSNL